MNAPTIRPKVIALAVSGSIAAYKAPELVRLFIKAGCEVHVLLSAHAERFVAHEALAVVSKQPVVRASEDDVAATMQHIAIARRIDALVIAPATADTIAALAAGRADTVISAVKLATRAPVFIAPAMNEVMWCDPMTTANINTLRDSGCVIIAPDSGEQACGDIGPGRLAELPVIVRTVLSPPAAPLAGVAVVMTAGPTREALDPVRFLSNHSSGKMGYALAAACTALGARVTIVSGPVAIEAPVGCDVVSVVSADEMFAAVQRLVDDCSIFIGAAAVCDYTPVVTRRQKIKKRDDNDVLSIDCRVTVDIVRAVATAQRRPPLVVGFCAETDDIISAAKAKLRRKACDVIIANAVGGETGFHSDDNEVTWVSSDAIVALPRAPKTALAATLADRLATLYHTITDDTHC